VGDVRRGARSRLILDAAATAAQTGPVRRGLLLFVPVAVACGALVGCGSGAKGPPGTWWQSGRTVHATWKIPSQSNVNLELTRGGTIAGCITRSKGRSQPGVFLIIGGEPAAYFPIGKKLHAGDRARTVCKVSGVVTEVDYGTKPFRHLKRTR
jgi:hypothetical protein